MEICQEGAFSFALPCLKILINVLVAQRRRLSTPQSDKASVESFTRPPRTDAEGTNFIKLDLLFRCRVSRTQMSLLFHFQNNRRKILLLSLGQLCLIDHESRSCRWHLSADRSCEVENQPKILVH